MARNKLSWNNVSGDANAGSALMGSGSRMLAGALKNLRAPIDRASEIAKQNADSESKANTGMYLDEIRKGGDPAMSGFYDSGAVSDGRYGYMKDERANEIAQERLQMSRNAAARSAANSVAANRRADAAARRRTEGNARTDALIASMMGGDQAAAAGGGVSETPMRDVVENQTPATTNTESAFVMPGYGATPMLNQAIGKENNPVNPEPIMGNEPMSAFAPPVDNTLAEQSFASANNVPLAQMAQESMAPEVNPVDTYLGGVDHSQSDAIRSNFDGDLEAAALKRDRNKDVGAAMGGYKGVNYIQKAEDYYAKDVQAIEQKRRVYEAQRGKEVRDYGTKKRSMSENQSSFESSVSGVNLDGFTPETAVTENQKELLNVTNQIKALSSDGVISKNDMADVKGLAAKALLLQGQEDKINMSQLESRMSFVEIDENGNSTQLPENEKTLKDKIDQHQRQLDSDAIKYKSKDGIAELKTAAEKRNEESGYNDTSSFGRNFRGYAGGLLRQKDQAFDSLFNTPGNIAKVFSGKKYSEEIEKNQLADEKAINDAWEQKTDKKVTSAQIITERNKVQEDAIALLTKNRKALESKRQQNDALSGALKSKDTNKLQTMIAGIKQGIDKVALDIPGTTESQKNKMLTKILNDQLKNIKASGSDRAKANSARKKFIAELKLKEASTIRIAERKNQIKNRDD